MLRQPCETRRKHIPDGRVQSGHLTRESTHVFGENLKSGLARTPQTLWDQRDAWLDLLPEERELLSLEFDDKANVLWKEFDDAKPAEPELPKAPQIALRVFAQRKLGR